MFVFARAVTYATLLVGLVLIFLPARVLTSSGIIPPTAIGSWQAVGMLLGATGATLALSCIFAFVFMGRGTPAPFDPPRRLVVQGPYRFVRNPMYIGPGLRWPEPRSSINRSRFSATREGSFWSPICLS